ncbi:hypothetical protein [Exiguobacterium antarcticum]|uniref:hypothetical protein n=1 Tax=Exiguobacterium antarcticum TaxID=132920 RepID=UPI001360B0F1|nr:hypothetical protein [Exiguobacterium soli]MCT4781524.1 hypothetical protein [Exiguobacterium soli]
MRAVFVSLSFPKKEANGIMMTITPANKIVLIDLTTFDDELSVKSATQAGMNH